MGVKKHPLLFSFVSTLVFISILGSSCGIAVSTDTGTADETEQEAAVTEAGISGDSSSSDEADTYEEETDVRQEGTKFNRNPLVPESDVDIYNKSFDWPPDDPEDWVMSPTVIGFGNNLDHDPDRAPWVHSNGARYISEISLWNHDGWRSIDDLPPEMEDAYVTDIHGNPVYSQEMLYLNLMHPAFREWLKGHIRFELDCGADGFVIDEISGASDAVYQGAGLDEYALSGFGRYLEQHYSTEELVALGIASVQDFDYREYLDGNGLLQTYTNGGFRDVSLGWDYYQYLQQETQDVMLELIRYARQYAAGQGREIDITANFHPLYETTFSTIDEELDYYTFEHGYIESDWRLEPPYATIDYGYPIAPGVKYTNSKNQKSVVLMAIPDYGALADIGEPEATSLVLHSFAETYASLGFFCYFDLGYGFIGNKYVADHARMRPYYAFLRDHPELFNGVSAIPRVAVVMPPRVTRDDIGPIDSTQGVAWALDTLHIDYAMIDMSSAINDYEMVIVQGYAWSDKELTILMDYMESGGNVMAIDGRFASRDETWEEVNRPDLAALKVDGSHASGDGTFTFFEDYIGWKYYTMFDEASLTAISEPVLEAVEANTAPDGVIVYPYYDGNDVTVHILNNNWNGNDYSRLSDISISIVLPDGMAINGESLMLASPDSGETTAIPYTIADGRLSFTIPELYIWSAVTSR